jgi:hypothetical protein
MVSMDEGKRKKRARRIFTDDFKDRAVRLVFDAKTSAVRGRGLKPRTKTVDGSGLLPQALELIADTSSMGTQYRSALAYTEGAQRPLPAHEKDSRARGLSTGLLRSSQTF